MAADRHQAQSYPLRMPDELKTKMQEAAAKSGRSLHGELLFRLEQSVSGEVGTSDSALLAAELAKAKRDAAYAAYISERWLVSLVMLWDVYLNVIAMCDALGFRKNIPRDWRLTAKMIGEEADDEFKRHSEDFDPMALHDFVEATEQEYQAALAGVVRMVSNAPVPTTEQAKAVKAIRERILARDRREFLPVDTTPTEAVDPLRAARKP